MKKKFIVFTTLIIVALFGLILFLPVAFLPVANPEEVGLVWKECPLLDLGGPQQIDDCFGRSTSSLSQDEKFIHGDRIDMQNYLLKIGSDTYWTRMLGDLFGYEWFALYKNGWPIHLLIGPFYAHSPNIGLYGIGGKVAWQFVNGEKSILIYDGQNLNRKYGFSQAFSPYSLGGKMVFIGKQGDKYFIVYDGKKLAPEFDEIYNAYCCEGFLYAPRGENGMYVFNGVRYGQHYLLAITTIEN